MHWIFSNLLQILLAQLLLLVNLNWLKSLRTSNTTKNSSNKLKKKTDELMTELNSVITTASGISKSSRDPVHSEAEIRNIELSLSQHNYKALCRVRTSYLPIWTIDTKGNGHGHHTYVGHSYSRPLK